MASPRRRLWGRSRLLQGQGNHGGVGEQLGADVPADGGQLLGPVAGGVGVQLQAGIDLVDQPVDQVGLAADMGVEGVGSDAEAVGQAAHGQRPGAVLAQQGQGLLDDQLPGEEAPPLGRLDGLVASALHLTGQGDILATAVPGFPVWDLGGLLGSTLWGLWVLALGVAVLRRPASQPATGPRATRCSRRRPERALARIPDLPFSVR
jgi:hypothetical protein